MRLRPEHPALLCLAILAGTNLLAAPAAAYTLVVRTAPGATGRLIFALTGGDSAANTAVLSGFRHNGTVRLLEDVQEGWPMSGGLFAGENPADSTFLGTETASTELAIDFVPFGDSIITGLGLSESSASPGTPDAELAMWLSDTSGFVHITSADPTGAGALFAWEVNGLPGGELHVFAPLVLVPPDTLLLDARVAGVPTEPRTGGRLRFHALAPNPSRGSMRLEFTVPEPGGTVQIDVYDVAGRRVSRSVLSTDAGHHAEELSIVGPGPRRANASVYFVALTLAGETVCRRVTVTR